MNLGLELGILAMGKVNRHSVPDISNCMAYIPRLMTLSRIDPWTEVKKRSLFLSKIDKSRSCVGPDWLRPREVMSF